MTLNVSPPHSPRHVVVIGGGLAGLAASYDLIRAGYRVTILEAQPTLGGLASSLRIDGQAVERFYHFICRADRCLIELVEELGLEDKLHWRPSYTQFYYDGKLYSFSKPFDLLFFDPVPWLQRFRFGLHIVWSRYRKKWRSLDLIPAKEWLVTLIGKRAYDVIWHPLLYVKFGEFHDRISAAWIWHRINRVATSRRRLWEREYFGCLEKGSATLVDALVSWLSTQPGAMLRTEALVQEIVTRNGRVEGVRLESEKIACDAVISTAALPVLARMTPDLPPEYAQKLSSVQYIGVVCVLLNLDRPFMSSFWTNINDPRISFNGVIEQTSLNHNWRDAGLNILYVPYYLPTSHPRYSASDEQLFDEIVGMLKLLKPDFDHTQVREYHVSRARYAQAICSTGFANLIPDHQSPVQGLYVTDSTQFYPEDRTLSAAIKQGRIVARLIGEQIR